MERDKWQENTNIVIDNINIERVESFQYLGAMLKQSPANMTCIFPIDTILWV